MYLIDQVTLDLIAFKKEKTKFLTSKSRDIISFSLSILLRETLALLLKSVYFPKYYIINAKFVLKFNFEINLPIHVMVYC